MRNVLVTTGTGYRDLCPCGDPRCDEDQQKLDEELLARGRLEFWEPDPAPDSASSPFPHEELRAP